MDRARLITVTGAAGVGKTRFAEEVAAELGDAGGVTLCTAEQPLRLPGERPYRLRPLAESPAVELFRQRAEANDGGFDASYAAVADLCLRLGRLPLAIELVAAHGAAALCEPVERRWTLPEAIEWSYEWLSGDDREALGVFADGGSIDDETTERLVRLRLLTPRAEGVRIHPAVRDFAVAA